MEVRGYSERLYEGFSADFISCDPVLIQILTGRTSKITSEDFCVWNYVICFVITMNIEAGKKPFFINYYTGKQSI